MPVVARRSPADILSVDSSDKFRLQLVPCCASPVLNCLPIGFRPSPAQRKPADGHWARVPQNRLAQVAEGTVWSRACDTDQHGNHRVSGLSPVGFAPDAPNSGTCSAVSRCSLGTFISMGPVDARAGELPLWWPGHRAFNPLRFRRSRRNRLKNRVANSVRALLGGWPIRRGDQRMSTAYRKRVGAQFRHCSVHAPEEFEACMYAVLMRLLLDLLMAGGKRLFVAGTTGSRTARWHLSICPLPDRWRF